MADLQIGAVIDGKGGKKYVYKGGDLKSRDSYTEFQPPKEEPSKFTQVVDKTNQAFDLLHKTQPSYWAAKGLEQVEDLVDKGAYSAGGKVTDVTGSPLLGYGTNVAVQAIPTILSGMATKYAAGKVTQPAGRMLMQSAVKPGKASILSGDAAKAVETMLKEGKNVSPGGMASLGKEVSALSQEVDDIIKAAGNSGKHVNVVSVLKPWSEKLKEAAGQINSKADVDATRKVLEEFLTDSRVKGAMSIPIETAQGMKTATYKALGSKAYGEMGTADIDAQKAIVRGLKEGIERAAPEVVPRNQRMSELLNAIEVVEPRALTKGNANIGGLAALAENPVAGGAFMLDRSELFKSILGRFLYSGAPSIMGGAARLGVGTGMALSGLDE